MDVKRKAISKNEKKRTPEMARNRLAMFSDDTKKRRSCLMCDKMFNSSGPFNRRCPKCNRIAEMGKGGTLSKAHVYKVSTGDLNDFAKLNDFICENK